MARIRCISLEMLERMKPLTPHARNLASSLSIVCDDAGRVEHDPEIIAGILFPGDPAAVGQLDDWLAELERHGWIEGYSVAGIDYLRMIDWRTDQRVREPTPSKLPASPSEPLNNCAIVQGLRKIQGRGRNPSADQEPDEQATDSVSDGAFLGEAGDPNSITRERMLANLDVALRKSLESDKAATASARFIELGGRHVGLWGGRGAPVGRPVSSAGAVMHAPGSATAEAARVADMPDPVTGNAHLARG